MIMKTSCDTRLLHAVVFSKEITLVLKSRLLPLKKQTRCSKLTLKTHVAICLHDFAFILRSVDPFSRH